MLWFTGIPFAIATAFALTLGPLAALAFAVQSAMAVTLLEAVNSVAALPGAIAPRRQPQAPDRLCRHDPARPHPAAVVRSDESARAGAVRRE